jgi:protocatechuate 3,4-dioxygenase beta subunit
MTPPHPDRDSHPDRFGRRESLVKAGGLAIAVLGAGAVTAGAAPSLAEATAVSCVLAPELTEGPFYIPNEKVRRNIREGERGIPLALQLGVVRSSDCKPITGAAVDIWHADAGGNYSGFGSDGAGSRTFLRGIQRTDAKGIARFDTIYPGWYQGRAVHIHVKVHVSGNVVHTGQLFFDDALTDAVFRRTPYSARPDRDTRNRTDSIFNDGGRRSMLRVARRGTGYHGSISMGVRHT